MYSRAPKLGLGASLNPVPSVLEVWNGSHWKQIENTFPDRQFNTKNEHYHFSQWSEKMQGEKIFISILSLLSLTSSVRPGFMQEKCGENTFSCQFCNLYVWTVLLTIKPSYMQWL